MILKHASVSVHSEKLSGRSTISIGHCRRPAVKQLAAKTTDKKVRSSKLVVPTQEAAYRAQRRGGRHSLAVSFASLNHLDAPPRSSALVFEEIGGFLPATKRRRKNWLGSARTIRSFTIKQLPWTAGVSGFACLVNPRHPVQGMTTPEAFHGHRTTTTSPGTNETRCRRPPTDCFGGRWWSSQNASDSNRSGGFAPRSGDSPAHRCPRPCAWQTHRTRHRCPPLLRRHVLLPPAFGQRPAVYEPRAARAAEAGSGPRPDTMSASRNSP